MENIEGHVRMCRSKLTIKFTFVSPSSFASGPALHWPVTLSLKKKSSLATTLMSHFKPHGTYLHWREMQCVKEALCISGCCKKVLNAPGTEVTSSPIHLGAPWTKEAQSIIQGAVHLSLGQCWCLTQRDSWHSCLCFKCQRSNFQSHALGFTLTSLKSKCGVSSVYNTTD